MEFSQSLLHRLNARFGVIWVQTPDLLLFYKRLRAVALEGDYTLYKWTSAEGLMEMGLIMDTVLPIGDAIGDVRQVLTEAVRRTDELSREIFVVEGIADLMHYTDVKILLQKLAVELPTSKYPMHVILPSPRLVLPEEVVRFVDLMSMPEATQEDLREVLKELEKGMGMEIGAELADRLAQTAVGMTLLEAKNTFRLVAVETGFVEAGVAVVQRELERIQEKLDSSSGND